MTDKDRSGKSPVSTSFSPAGGVVIIPGNSDEQLIDMDESYQTVTNEKIDHLVDGAETYLKTGCLHRTHAVLAKLQGAENFDPMLSRRNGILGGENFLIKIRDGFVNFIKMIIEYIRKAVVWILDKVKGFFGFGKTTERVAQIEAKSGAIKNDLVTLLEKLKLGNESVFDIEHFFANKPQGLNRIETIQYIQNRFRNAVDAVEGTEESLKISKRIQATLIRVSRDIVSDRNRLSRKINEMRDEFKSKRLSTNSVMALVGLCNEIKMNSLNFDNLYSDIIKLEEAFKGNKLSPDMAKGLTEAADKVAGARKLVSEKMNPKEASVMSRKVAGLIVALSETKDQTVQTSFDDATINELLNLDDVNFVRSYIQVLSPNDQTYASAFETAYLGMANAAKNYVAINKAFITTFKDVVDQVTSFVQWKQWTDALLNALVAKDAQILTDTYLDIKRNTGVDLSGMPPVTIIPDIDRSSTGRVAGVIINDMMKHNVNQVADRANNALRQLGINPEVIHNG